MGAELIYAVRSMGINLIVAVRNIANTPKMYEVVESEVF